MRVYEEEVTVVFQTEAMMMTILLETEAAVRAALTSVIIIAILGANND